tara:strand:+ start:6875 stop:7741 length:867 start_codon:yes stop_codon:yes gene_type:complete
MTFNELKIKTLIHMSNVPSFKKSWPIYTIRIKQIIGLNPNGNDLFKLGDSLSDIFKPSGTSSSQRTQSNLSSGGNAWECLVVWYLNLVFWNTNVIVTKYKKENVPQIIRQATSVGIGNVNTNTESDIIAFGLPNYQNDNDDIEEFLENNTHSCDLSIVQCKTNWNDNSQIPMLWDMVYNSTNTFRNRVSVGSNGVSPSSFRKFSYAFATIPTNTNQNFNADSTHVLRVSNLSGGNYWGHPSKPSVAQSLNEYFTSNFNNYFHGSIQNHLDNNLAQDPSFISKFLDLNF